jgi:hypothetical protein
MALHKPSQKSTSERGEERKKEKEEYSGIRNAGTQWRGTIEALRSGLNTPTQERGEGLAQVDWTMMEPTAEWMVWKRRDGAAMCACKLCKCVSDSRNPTYCKLVHNNNDVGVACACGGYLVHLIVSRYTTVPGAKARDGRPASQLGR